MTGYTVHTGSSLKFSSGWDRIFEGKPASKPAGHAGRIKKSASASGKKKTAAQKSVAKVAKAPAKSVVKKAARPAKKKTGAKAAKRGK